MANEHLKMPQAADVKSMSEETLAGHIKKLDELRGSGNVNPVERHELSKRLLSAVEEMDARLKVRHAQIKDPEVPDSVRSAYNTLSNARSKRQQLEHWLKERAVQDRAAASDEVARLKEVEEKAQKEVKPYENQRFDADTRGTNVFVKQQKYQKKAVTLRDELPRLEQAANEHAHSVEQAAREHSYNVGNIRLSEHMVPRSKAEGHISGAPKRRVSFIRRIFKPRG